MPTNSHGFRKPLCMWIISMPDWEVKVVARPRSRNT
jgi:hypothetical protein